MRLAEKIGDVGVRLDPQNVDDAGDHGDVDLTRGVTLGELSLFRAMRCFGQ